MKNPKNTDLYNILKLWKNWFLKEASIKI